MRFNDFEKLNLEESARILRAIAHPLRLRLINFIAENQPVKVYEIHSQLNLDQSVASQHLRILREAKVVITERNGKYIYYHTDDKKISNTGKAILKFDKLTLLNRKQR